MLQITADIFSGRPNPSWIVTDADATDQLLKRIADNPQLIAAPGRGWGHLSYREVIVTTLNDDSRVPQTFALGAAGAEAYEESASIARQLVQSMAVGEATLVSHALTPPTPEIRDLTLEQLDKVIAERPPVYLLEAIKAPAKRTTVKDVECKNGCAYEISKFNPAFWNSPAVQPYNNCYNYARNWKTNTFAQPGRAHGAMYGALTCPAVSTAARADGLANRCDCLPDSEYPRRLVALVVGPGYDYHWYREQQGGFWGHKPGGTAAKNTDNNGALIRSPETCARGPYTDFCGYFYAGRSVVIN